MSWREHDYPDMDRSGVAHRCRYMIRPERNRVLVLVDQPETARGILGTAESIQNVIGTIVETELPGIPHEQIAVYVRTPHGCTDAHQLDRVVISGDIDPDRDVFRVVGGRGVTHLLRLFEE